MPEELQLILCILVITLIVVHNKIKKTTPNINYRKTNQSYKPRKHKGVKSKNNKRKNTPQLDENYINACWEELKKH